MLKHFFFLIRLLDFYSLPRRLCSLWPSCIFSLWMKIPPLFLTGSVLICELTLGNGCLNRVDLIHRPKSCLLPYIFNGDSHIAPMTHALSHAHMPTQTHTHTPLTEEKQLQAWLMISLSFSSLRCVSLLVLTLLDSKISPRYFNLPVFNCFVATFWHL